MEINQLLQVLRHGYSYTITSDREESYPMLVPPNKHMLAAGKLITALIADLERTKAIAIQNSVLAAEAFSTCEQLTKELNDAKTTIQAGFGNSVDGDAKTDVGN